MPVKTLKKFLDSQDVSYVSISHLPAYSAQTIAASAHIPGKELVKTVIVKIDDKFAMVVLPASCRVHLGHLKVAVLASQVGLATETELESHTELIRMSYKDFERLVRPRITALT